MSAELSFGRWLKRRRSGLGFTQAELGRRVGYAEATIRKIEADELRPSRQLAEKLADELAIPAEERAAFIRFARDEAIDPSPIPTQTASLTPTVPPTPPHNLPTPRDPLIGREQDVAAVQSLLLQPTVGLVTLAGPGGVGKTRLALAVAHSFLESRTWSVKGDEATPRSTLHGPPSMPFSDGVYFVNLAPIEDPRLVVTTIAHTLGVTEKGTRSLLDSLTDFLRAKRLLLILDNFEQVLAAAPLVADLLLAAPHLTTLATSREPLRVRGEYHFAVLPLELPQTNGSHPAPDLTYITQSPAVQLFVARARAARADFTLTDENAPAITKICIQLDGLPLAIELAAARSRLFTPQALLARLEPQLKFLTGGARDLPTRQQTLRATLDWSHALLDEAEKILFRRLAVFVGGCTLEAAEAVCNTDEALPDVLGVFASLVDKNLLQQVPAPGVDGGTARFRRLRVIREYAQERLAESGETDMMSQRHAQFFLALTEATAPELTGANQSGLLNQLEVEHDNLRAALEWYNKAGGIDEGLRLAIAMFRFWEMRGHLREGYDRLVRLLGRATKRTTPHAGALWIAGRLAFSLGDYTAATAHLEACLDMARELGEKPYIAAALNNLGLIAASGRGDYTTAAALYEESLALRRALGDKRGIGAVLNNLANVADAQGHYALARAWHEESLAIGRELGDLRSVAIALNNLGVLARNEGDYTTAYSYFSESLSIRQKMRDQTGIASSLNNLGLVVCHQGDYAEARALCEESLRIGRELANPRSVAYSLYYLALITYREGGYDVARVQFEESLAMRRELGDKSGIGHCLAGLAGLAAAQAQPERAGRLLGASAALLETIGALLSPGDRAIYETSLTSARAALGEERFEAAVAVGRAMTLEQAMAYALSSLTSSP